MLPKKRRIERKDFQYILANSRKFNSPILLLNIAKLDNIEKESKISFSISKKISKSAVKRNRFRRIGYSIIEKNYDKIKQGFFIFFNFKKGIENYNPLSLEKEILELLSKSFVLK